MSQMDVILLQRIESLGQMGDVVKVKPGFARNYLLPQKKAMRATKENMAFFEKQRAQLEAQNLKQRADAEAVAAKMGDKFAVVIIRQAGESGMLYGSVSTRDIADAITAGGVTVERNQVILDKAIKMLGLTDIKVQLHPEVRVAVSLNVARTVEEAERQARGENVLQSEAEKARAEADAMFEEAAAARAAAEAEDEAADDSKAEAKKQKKAAKADKDEDAGDEGKTEGKKKKK